MEKVIATALLTAAAVVAAVMIINALLPSVGRGASTVQSSSEAVSSQIETDIDIIAVDANGTKVTVWIKNVGASNVLAINLSNLFIEEIDTSFTSMSFDSEDTSSDCSDPVPLVGSWIFCREGGATSWKPGDTVRFTMTLSIAASGDYQVQFITNNGVEAKKSFSA